MKLIYVVLIAAGIIIGVILSQLYSINSNYNVVIDTIRENNESIDAIVQVFHDSDTCFAE